jgi:hypothetical protein
LTTLAALATLVTPREESGGEEDGFHVFQDVHLMLLQGLFG